MIFKKLKFLFSEIYSLSHFQVLITNISSEFCYGELFLNSKFFNSFTKGVYYNIHLLKNSKEIMQ